MAICNAHNVSIQNWSARRYLLKMAVLHKMHPGTAAHCWIGRVTPASWPGSNTNRHTFSRRRRAGPHCASPAHPAEHHPIAIAHNAHDTESELSAIRWAIDAAPRTNAGALCQHMQQTQKFPCNRPRSGIPRTEPVFAHAVQRQAKQQNAQMICEAREPTHTPVCCCSELVVNPKNQSPLWCSTCKAYHTHP